MPSDNLPKVNTDLGNNQAKIFPPKAPNGTPNTGPSTTPNKAGVPTANSRNDRIQAHSSANKRDKMELPVELPQWNEIQETLGGLLAETFLRLKENCYGSPSFIKQNEVNIENDALYILALFHESLELQTPRTKPKQTEYPADHSYNNSIANFGDFDEKHSYIDDDAWPHERPR